MRLFFSSLSKSEFLLIFHQKVNKASNLCFFQVMAKTRLWNVIVVDWAPLSHAIYVEARVHTPVVSKQVFRLLLSLNRFNQA